MLLNDLRSDHLLPVRGTDPGPEWLLARRTSVDVQDLRMTFDLQKTLSAATNGALDIAPGDRFGQLVVLDVAHTQGGNRHYRCLCDCGSETVVRRDRLRIGKTRSCGCLVQVTQTKHGHSRRRSPTYGSWACMRVRCLNSTHNSWQYYGALGVTICARWESFAAFLEDMGERPPGKSLDRIDPYGNYTPENCRWATPMEQTHNRRRPQTDESAGDEDTRGGPSMPSQTVQPAPGALLGDWVSWIAAADDDEECSRRLGVASGRGADPWRIARHLQRQREERS